MAKIVNLRTRRKQKERDAARKLGGARSAKFGRSKAEKTDQTRIAKGLSTHLDGHKRED